MRNFARLQITVEDQALVSSKPEPVPVAHAAPLAASYNHRIRPLLDAIDGLRSLMDMKEGIQLPTIVVVGDKSSGKSSVLESLAGINLPRGQGICTRVPLFMRLQNNPRADRPELYLEFNGKVIHTDEDNISEAINDATDEIAGDGKGISNAPLTLVVKKDGVPDLTMVDLPGITRVPVHGQPENIHEQISEMIMEYIRPEESIILNVLSATVDFSTCESIRMSQMVDKTGRRTLAVVTKADKAPEGLLEKLMAHDVNIGLGYVCVRNRIGNESCEEARLEEAKLFGTCPLLCKIDKSIVGVPVLAQKLTQIQASIIAKYLPDIVMKINDKLDANVAELKRMPRNLSSAEDAMMAFTEIMGSAKESLRKVLLRGEIDEYLDQEDMHCTARLVEMLNQYYAELQKCTADNPKKFLLEEMEVLTEVKGIGLPDVLPHTALLTHVQQRLKEISSTSPSFVARVWDYIEGVVIQALMRYSENYPLLQSSTRRAASNLINKMKGKTMNRMMKIVEMEKLTDYTCNPEYLVERNKLMSQRDKFMEEIKNAYNTIDLQGIGDVNVHDLWFYDQQLVRLAFDLKMRMTPYWKIVLSRFVDSVALHLRFSVQNLVSKEMEKEIRRELCGPNIKRMMEEKPEIVEKREKLNRSIELLRESAGMVAEFMDRVATDGGYNH